MSTPASAPAPAPSAKPSANAGDRANAAAAAAGAKDSKRKARTMSRRGRRLRFTREGKYFVALTLGIGFAAINTGNNLLYLVLGMLLTLIVGSGVLSEVALYALSVERAVPERIFADRPVLIGIALRNNKSRQASFSIEVEDMQSHLPLDKKCYFLKVPAGRTQQTSYRHTFDRRGRYELTGFQISTKFPFALFRKSRQQRAAQEVIVYPAIYPVSPRQARGLGLGEERVQRLGRRGEFVALREYREGDDPGDIYWRKSARVNRPVIRQNEDPAARQVAIFVDNCQRSEVLSLEDIDEQEAAVSRAASLAAHYIEQGYAVALVTRTASVKSDSGPAQLHRVLRALALLEFPRDEAPYAAPAHWAGEILYVTVRGSAVAAQSAAATATAAEA